MGSPNYRYSDISFFENLFESVSIVRTGGAPGELGSALASLMKRRLISVSWSLFMTLPIPAVPPGWAALTFVV